MKARIACILFVLSATLSIAAQQTFLVTNDDPFRRPNSVSTYAIQSDGSLLLVGKFPSGGAGGSGTGDPSGQGIGSIATTRIVVSQDNKFVFATNAPDNTVSAFSLDSSTGLLTLVPGSPFATGGNACQGMGLAISPNAQFLFAMNTCSQDVTSFKIGADGSLSVVGPPASLFTAGVDIKVTGDGKFVAVSLHGFNVGVDIFSIGPGGSLTRVPGSPFPGHGGFGSALEANCKGDLLFALEDFSPSVIDSFKVGADGSLTSAPNSPFLMSLPSAANGEVSFYLSPDEKALFVSDVASFASSFTVDSQGSLTPVSSFVPATGTFFFGHVVTDPTGKFLYASGLFSNLAAYSVDSNAALTLLPGSPFTLSGGFSAIGSFAAIPAKTCRQTIPVNIRVQPDGGNTTRTPVISAGSNGLVQVAILSSAGFDATTQVDTTSLTFGRTGSEPSLVSCQNRPGDINRDGLADLVCSFAVRAAAFLPGDTQATLRGKTIHGATISGTADIRAVP
ncbi:MAG TPA: beta-propeller fold lactonase family protein [Candidatus Angelobacter sp.]